ncbi:MAG: chemotaxis protein CheW [Thermodesulfobacteriota bacterium]|nr:chemotaxis protein CheW [Thermodesulfobacteriota bacterium]
MLVLLFYLGEVMYTIRCDRVREVAPVVTLKHVPHAPDYFAGLFNYRGMIVPVIDLCKLIQGRSCVMRLSTRIILVDYLKEGTSPYVVGLMAERVTEAVRKPESALVSSGINMRQAPYLGRVVMDENNMIQYIDLDLLPSTFQFLPMLESGIANESEDN